jgi:hypothetical protein
LQGTSGLGYSYTFLTMTVAFWIHLCFVEQYQTMLSSLKSLIRPSASGHSAKSAHSDNSSSTSSLVNADQFPFPTNPTLVKKARHEGCPKHLPSPQASINDVRYFLFILLTSMLNNCAKHYPEWVLETCMAWNGEGWQFLDCTQEQLEALCPRTATAVAIYSPKHKPGTHIPFPARLAIGEAIAKFVLQKREGESQAHMIRRRLKKERDREVPDSPTAAQDLRAFRAAIQTPQQPSSFPPVNLSQGYDTTAYKFQLSSTSTRTARRHRDNVLLPLLGIVTLPASPVMSPETVHRQPLMLDLPLLSTGSKSCELSSVKNITTELSAGSQKNDVPRSTLRSSSKTPIAESMSRSLSSFTINAGRDDKKQHVPQVQFSLPPTEQKSTFVNRQPGVNLFSQSTMPPAYLAPGSDVEAKDLGSIPSLQSPAPSRKQTSQAKESGVHEMRQDNGVSNGPQSMTNSTYPVPHDALHPVTANSLGNGVNFNTVNYGSYRESPNHGFNTACLVPNGILRNSVANSRESHSTTSSSKTPSTPATSINSDRRVKFAPSRYRGHNACDRSVVSSHDAQEGHYHKMELLREATGARNLQRAPTLRSHKSASTVRSFHDSNHNPQSSLHGSPHKPTPPIIQ